MAGKLPNPMTCLRLITASGTPFPLPSAPNQVTIRLRPILVVYWKSLRRFHLAKQVLDLGCK
jgi:hypothetical protein